MSMFKALLFLATSLLPATVEASRPDDNSGNPHHPLKIGLHWGDTKSETAPSLRHQDEPQISIPTDGPTGPHPLNPLTATEVKKTGDIIRRKKSTDEGWLYIAIFLKEPPKSVLVKSFLENTRPPKVPREAFATIVNKNSGKVCELIVNLDTGKVESTKELAKGIVAVPVITIEEYEAAIKSLSENPQFQKKCRKYGYNNFENILFAPWDVGFDDDKPHWQGRRMVQMITYEKLFDRDNAIAHPLPFTTVYDVLNKSIIEFEDFPIGEDFNNDLTDFTRSTSNTDNFDQSIPNTLLRKDVKPIVVTTPEGVSYTIKDHQIRWQKWQMQIGFNFREGLVIHHVGYYDNTKPGNKFRPLFYRLSVSEVWIPYNDPRPPYQRKAAFDQGHYGIGILMVSLYSPADCKGTAHFFDGVLNSDDGEPVVTKNSICIFEEDSGILWKHKDEVSGDNNVVRSQRLVLAYHSRVGNYDYLFYWHFYQDASIEFKVILSGILSPIPFKKNAKVPPYGIKVSEEIFAQIHQHFFCVRLDADIDGVENGVSTVDIVALDQATGSPENPYGNGMTYKYTSLKTAGEGRTKSAPLNSRKWSMQNENIKNRITGKPVSYVLKSADGPLCLLKLDSPTKARGNFTAFNTWVTQYREDQMFAAGKYLKNDGLSQWIEKDINANIWNRDVVLWHVLGVSHLPRIEDWPVMPAETTGFWLKPVNFFEQNPALDVPRVPTDEDFGAPATSRNRRRVM